MLGHGFKYFIICEKYVITFQMYFLHDSISSVTSVTCLVASYAKFCSTVSGALTLFSLFRHLNSFFFSCAPENCHGSIVRVTGTCPVPLHML